MPRVFPQDMIIHFEELKQELVWSSLGEITLSQSNLFHFACCYNFFFSDHQCMIYLLLSLELSTFPSSLLLWLYEWHGRMLWIKKIVIVHTWLHLTTLRRSGELKIQQTLNCSTLPWTYLVLYFVATSHAGFLCAFDNGTITADSFKRRSTKQCIRQLRGLYLF